MTTVAAAQSCSIACDINANVESHLRLMRLALSHRVDLLVFPELSLTGYEPQRCAELAGTVETAALQPLRELAASSGMTTVVGFPLRVSGIEKPMVASLIFGADGSVQVYCKQYLHDGEEAFFTAGPALSPLLLGPLPVALAVCADFSRPQHPAAAARAGASVYAASVLISKSGYPADAALLAAHAKQHQMAVLIANHGADSGGWNCAGRSALWGCEGQLVGEVPGVGEALLVAQRVGDKWEATVVRA